MFQRSIVIRIPPFYLTQFVTVFINTYINNLYYYQDLNALCMTLLHNRTDIRLHDNISLYVFPHFDFLNTKYGALNTSNYR